MDSEACQAVKLFRYNTICIVWPNEGPGTAVFIAKPIGQCNNLGVEKV